MPVRTIFDRAPIEEWFSSRVRGMQIAGRARLYLHTLKGTARAQPSRGHTAFQEWIYVRVSSSDFPIENAHRLPAKLHDISKYVPTNWFLPYLIPWFYLRKKCVQETYTILVFEDNFKYSNNEMFLSSMLFLTLKNVFTLSIHDRLRELTKVAKLLLPFSHVIIRAVNWNCARECICIEQRPINPIILWFFNHSSSIRWLPRQIELTKIPVLASSKIQPDLPAG